MKRNLLLLAVTVSAVLLFGTQGWAFCDADTVDLGICDTLYIETFSPDHIYDVTKDTNMVRIPMYITHDENVLQAGPPVRYDSIAGVVISLDYTVVALGPCTWDSVTVPTANQWNNSKQDPGHALYPKSMFRHLVNDKVDPPETTFNKIALTTQDPLWAAEWGVVQDFMYDPVGDSGHVNFSAIPPADGHRWDGGSKELFATYTFFVFGMNQQDCVDPAGMAICFDTTHWGPNDANKLEFTRDDAVNYKPRGHLGDWLEVCDTITIPPNFPPECFCSLEGEPCTCPCYAETHKDPVLFDFEGFDQDGDDLSAFLQWDEPAGWPPISLVIDADDPGHIAGHFVAVPYCSNYVCDTIHFEVKITDGMDWDTCHYYLHIVNNNPTIVCPGNVSGPYTQLMESDPWQCSDPDGDHTTTYIAYVNGGPTNMPYLDYGTGTVKWDPDLDCDKVITVGLYQVDQCGGYSDTCEFTMTSVNDPPNLTCGPDRTVSVNTTTVFAGSYSFTDENAATVVIGVSCNLGTVTDLGSGNIQYDAPANPGLDVVYVTATDECQEASACTFLVDIKAGIPNQVKIPNQVYQRYGFDYCYVYQTEDDRVELHDECPLYIEGAAHPGDFVSIPIVLENFVEDVNFGAFEFEVEFDYIDLTFYGAERGDLLWAVWTEPYEDDPSQDVVWSWEYFSYRLCPCTVPACQKYKILVYGQSEMPDGLLRRGYCITLPNLDPNIAEWDRFDPPLDLVWFKFQIANNELLRDTKLPVRFEWEAKVEDGVVVDDWDCAENTMSNCDGDTLYASEDDFQFADLCFDEMQNPPEDILTFIDGGIHICSPCSAFKCVRGDINLDHIPNSAADAVMLARAIVHGTYAVFTLDYEAQMCASDINADGRSAMLADLIYLIRIIQRDAVPYPKLGPSSEVANVILSDGLISVECGAEIGGLLFEFDGAVTPTLLATNMELIAHEGRILVWSSEGNSMTSGEVLSAVGAELVSVTAVDRDGRDLATTITAKVAPSAFALHPAYPNPFNPYTNLSFTLPTASAYTMKIYNVAGQMVRSYEGMGAAGLNVITWDGKDNAGNDVSSGVYFVRFAADMYKATTKMVLMK